MEQTVQEYDLLAPAEGLVEKRTSKLELTPQEKLLLANWAQSNEYSVFLKLFEGIIEIQETVHFRLWKDKEAFERTGLVAVAMRMAFERLQKEVNTQFEEFAGEVEFARVEKEVQNESPEERIQRGFRQ